MTDINVAAYGATGTGTDDTAAFEGACAAAKPGDTIVFDQGRFGLSRTIRPPCSVRGLDRNVSTMFALPGAGAAVQPLIDFTDKSGVTFSRGFLEGEGVYAATPSGSGSIGALSIGASSRPVGDVCVRDAGFRNFKADYWVLGWATVAVTRTRLTGNYFETKQGDAPVYGDHQAGGGQLVALYGSATAAMVDTRIEDNDVVGDGVALGFFLVSQHRRYAIRRNNIVNMGRFCTPKQNSYPICVYGATEDLNQAFGDIAENIIIGCASAGIYAAQSDHLSVIGNYIYNQNHIDDETLPRGGIVFNGCDGFLAEANNIDSCWGGIAVTSADFTGVSPALGGDLIGNRIFSQAGGSPYGIRCDGPFAATGKVTALMNTIDLPVAGSQGFRWNPTGCLAVARGNIIRASVAGLSDLVNNPFTAV